MTAIENEDVGNGVQNQQQLRTQRKIKVNAQITFVLWLMESSINIVPVIVSLFIGSMGPTTFTLNMVLFLIILPYTYLSNTSHNKRRIAEEGWLNVLKNVLPCTGNNARDGQIRIYVISGDPLICSLRSTKDKDTKVDPIIHNGSRLQANNKTDGHSPTQEENDSAKGTTEQGKNQTEIVVLHGMQHGRH